MGASLSANQLLKDARALLPARLSPVEAAAEVRDGALLIDIRDGDQRRADGYIPGAIVEQRNSLEWRCDPASGFHRAEISGHDVRLILICNQGFQSSLAAANLQRFGLHRATDVVGGFQAWRDAGLPVMPPDRAIGRASIRTPAEQRSAHWDGVYSRSPFTGLSWYQRHSTASLRMIEALGFDEPCSVVDVGGGTSTLAHTLSQRGWRDVTVLDVSERALRACRRRLGAHAGDVNLLRQDVLTWRPDRRYDLWHDRAALHFFVDVEDRIRYVDTLKAALAPGGAVIIGVFADDGPTMCSGLPVMRYSLAQLISLLGDDFELEHQEREQHRTPKGAMQSFQWASFRG